MLTENRLWQLIVALYQQPGIEPLCLQAQHEQGAEVNLLLLLALLQAQGVPVDYKPLRYAVAPLQPALQQWRLARRALKGKLGPDRDAERGDVQTGRGAEQHVIGGGTADQLGG